MSDTREPTAPGPEPQVEADAPLRLIEHRPDLLGGTAHGFGCLLFDAAGRPVVRDGRTWLYTTRPTADGWESWVRSFDPIAMTAGEPTLCLVPPAGEARAVLHHVLALDEDLVVGFYSNGLGVGAAIARTPEGPFEVDPGFVFAPEVGWETRGQTSAGWSLEVNGAHVPCADGTSFWLGYDSYRRDGRLGDLGWAKVAVERTRRRVVLLGRHPGNPLPFRRPHWRCARCGGNLASDLRIGGKRAFFYYLRGLDSEVMIGLALSDDPLFFRDCRLHIVDKVLGDEEVAEKFQVLPSDDGLILLYENRLRDGSWRTGLRRYGIVA